MSTLRLLAAGGEPASVQVERRRSSGSQEEIAASIAGEMLTFSWLPAEGGGLMRIGAQLNRYFALRRGAGVLLWIGGYTYEFAAPEVGAETGPAGGREALPPGGIIEAPMPGRVLKILVGAGDEVEGGAALAILESMKMELTVTAPAAGRVAEVCTAPEAMVQRGAALVRIEETG